MPADGQGASNRIVSLDILRGMALMGMILVHFHQKMEFEVDAGLEGLIGWIIWMGVEGKSWGTFAFLFGAGFAVLMRRLEARGKPVTAIFMRRMLILAVIGLAVITLTGFTILLDYAIWGVVLFLVRNWSTRALLVLAVVSAMATTVVNVTRSAVAVSRLGPERAAAAAKARQARSSGKWELVRNAETTRSYSEAVRARWSHTKWQYLRWEALIPSSNLVLFILGLLAIRHGVFDDPLGKKRAIVIAMLIGLASWAAAWWLLPKIPADTTINGIRVPFRFGLGIVSDQWMAITYVGAVTLLLAHFPGAVRRLAVFGVAGRMALTNYVIQAALISWMAFGYGLSLEVRPYFVVLWTVVLFTGLAAFSKLWLSRFAYGPLEWMWRSLTYL
jgi:uncharacterized protein